LVLSVATVNARRGIQAVRSRAGGHGGNIRQACASKDTPLPAL
jgi:hypothetical protein